ncbi:hypothetical protein CTZ24_11370 [Pantoea phytobeneficialis]|uniref:Uncharacterized protein n=1 Tax=Pantoea phytobeneficialis TaxID=2052056 RepID=A0AAP9H5K4_9GAMM|nr:hypothetical protein CTZ24_11370 [Pantoea phytobeneficialis]
MVKFIIYAIFVQYFLRMIISLNSVGLDKNQPLDYNIFLAVTLLINNPFLCRQGYAKKEECR